MSLATSVRPVDTSSLDIMTFMRELGVLYIDTVVEPWAGYYFGTTDNAARTNYALRQSVREEKDGKVVMNFYRIVDGKEVLSMRLTYSKKEG